MMKKPHVKNRRLYYFTQAPWAIENIVLKRLKISDINSLNDPYELMGYFVGDTKKEDIKKFKKDVSGNYGIVCFSNSFQSPLMWSHYADKHRGICLGFDVCTDDCFDVVYSKSMANFQNKFKATLDSSNLKEAQKILFIKCKEWGYEKECRIFSPIPIDSSNSQSEFNFEQFGERLQLKEVIFGVQNNNDRASLKRFISQYYEGDIKLFRAALDLNQFRVNIVDETSESLN